MPPSLREQEEQEKEKFRKMQYGLISIVSLIFLWLILTAFLSPETKAEYSFVPLWDTAKENEEYKQQKEFEDTQQALLSGNLEKSSVYPDLWNTFDFMLANNTGGIEPSTSRLSGATYETLNHPRFVLKFDLNEPLDFTFPSVQKNIKSGTSDNNTAIIDCMLKEENGKYNIFIRSNNGAYHVKVSLNHFTKGTPMEMEGDVNGNKGFNLPIPKDMVKRGLYDINLHYEAIDGSGKSGDVPLQLEIVHSGSGAVENKTLSAQVFFSMFVQLSHDDKYRKGFSLQGKVRYAEPYKGSCKIVVQREYDINDNPLRYLPPFPFIASGLSKDDCERANGRNIFVEHIYPFNGGDVWAKNDGEIYIDNKKLDIEE